MMRRFAGLAAGLMAFALVPVAAVPSSAAEPRTATFVGSLQDELGCPGDWQPECATTRLDRVGETSTYAKVFDIPKGSFEVKVAINGAWDESYGLDGSGDNSPLVLGGPAKVRVAYDDETHLTTVTPTVLSDASIPADSSLAKTSLRGPLTRERFYFVMADRFANGSTANDLGGLTGDRLTTGFDPTDKGFYHGGDIKGIVDKLDYIKGLGTTAIWLTPSFKNRPVQGTGADASAGYHGYWITDFTQIDPHLGTNADMKALVNAAHAKGMKVFFDIITNHTADVIDYKGGVYDYVTKAARPYKDASGTDFDDAAYAGKDTFPETSVDVTFPYVPTFRT